MISDIDLRIIWDTPPDFLMRTAERYNKPQLCVSVEFLAYSPDELERVVDKPFVREILNEGHV